MSCVVGEVVVIAGSCSCIVDMRNSSGFRYSHSCRSYITISFVDMPCTFVTCKHAGVIVREDRQSNL